MVDIVFVISTLVVQIECVQCFSTGIPPKTLFTFETSCVAWSVWVSGIWIGVQSRSWIEMPPCSETGGGTGLCLASNTLTSTSTCAVSPQASAPVSLTRIVDRVLELHPILESNSLRMLPAKRNKVDLSVRPWVRVSNTICGPSK